MREIIKPGISLFTITLVASLLLSSANIATKGIIEQNNLASKQLAMARLMPKANGNAFSEDIETGGQKVISFNKGYDIDGNVCGYIFTVVVRGYSGEFEIFVGVGTDGLVTGVALGDNQETPGLGKNAEKDSFVGQYMNYGGTFRVVKNSASAEGEVEAVTASTITSSAVTDGVNLALEYFNANMKGD